MGVLTIPSGGKSWKTNKKGMNELIRKQRIFETGKTIRYIFYYEDYPVSSLHNVWTKTQGATNKTYIVQTSEKVIQRCILMTTDPGDLVFDPTCGGGTTAYVAEQWGRRWITCDTSRIAISLAKQRLLTSSFDYYELENPDEGIGSGFQYKKSSSCNFGFYSQE